MMTLHPDYIFCRVVKTFGEQNQKNQMIEEWAECPVCHGVPTKFRKYEREYGIVSPQQYDALKRGYDEHNGKQTVPVYFEHDLRENGMIVLSLSAKCEICDAVWNIVKVEIKGSKL